ncbi:unnamed protein product [Cylindrotheca closterium]|uniref:Coenzyme Q-binding protein COQ10 START domain-containing protein n=1 Tax=Cylindrotheca closterium TaxID=2856 RepID=A0AAD2CJR7_9STRA|nr:unnamed protein product [Cylindrotheca closterium]
MIWKSILAPVTKRHVQQKTIKTHPLHLFRIIQDVDDYVNFLPLCSYSKILRKAPDGRTFDGKLGIGFGLFSEEYTSRVTVIPETLTIKMKSIESQRINSLKSHWSLEEKQGKNNEVHCGVTFQLEMEVSDPVIVAVLDQVLQEVAGRQVEAFEKRCEELPLPDDLIEVAKRFKQL